MKMNFFSLFWLMQGRKPVTSFLFILLFFSPRTRRRAAYHCIKEESTQNLEYTYTQTKGQKPKPWEHTRTHFLYLLMYMRVCAMKNTQPHRGQPRKTVLECQSNTTFYPPQQVTRWLPDLVQQYSNIKNTVSRGSRHQGWWELMACCIGPLNDQQAKVPTVWRPNCCRRLNQNCLTKTQMGEQVR